MPKPKMHYVSWGNSEVKPCAKVGKARIGDNEPVRFACFDFFINGKGMGMKNIIITSVVVLAAAVCRADTKRVWRDANGRILGTETTDSMGWTTCRDSNGMLIGTARTDGNESCLYFGRSGSILGSSHLGLFFMSLWGIWFQFN